MSVSIVDSDAGIAINFTYSVLPAPAAVLAGVMSGATLIDAEMRPIAGGVSACVFPTARSSPRASAGILIWARINLRKDCACAD